MRAFGHVLIIGGDGGDAEPHPLAGQHGSGVRVVFGGPRGRFRREFSPIASRGGDRCVGEATVSGGRSGPVPLAGGATGVAVL